MTIREQVEVLRRLGVEFVVVGGQAGVLRQAVEFSHDLDVLIRPTRDNAARVVDAIRAITGLDADVDVLLGRDFQQYISPDDGTEIDIHLKLIALPDFDTATRNASDVSYLGLPTPCLELPALYASKRTDRPRDALHRRAIEDRVRHLLMRGEVAADEIVLALCLDAEVAVRVGGARLSEIARATRQPLLQARLLAQGGAAARELANNPSLHPTVAAAAQLDEVTRQKILRHPARFAALLAKLPLELPPDGYRLRR